MSATLKNRCLHLLFLFHLLSGTTSIHAQIHKCVDAKVAFVSNAPLEIISAESDEMQGLLDIESKRFAFKIYIKSFEGFNSNLQQNHFYENYMETSDYPLSTFSGKIVEDIKEGQGEYRAKGKLEIHGVTKEVLLPVLLNITDNEVSFESTFMVKLADHDIKIPKLVNQKIAESIEVAVSGVLKKKG